MVSTRRREFALDPRGALLHSDQANVPSLSVCGHVGVKSFPLSLVDRPATILIGLIRETFHLTKHGCVSSSGRDSPGPTRRLWPVLKSPPRS